MVVAVLNAKSHYQVRPRAPASPRGGPGPLAGPRAV